MDRFKILALAVASLALALWCGLRLYKALQRGRIKTNDPDMHWEIITRNRNPIAFWIHIAMQMAFFIFLVIAGCLVAYWGFTSKAHP
jgi:hypothetical protein